MKILHCILALCLLFTLNSCLSQPSHLPESSHVITPEPLKLKASPEVFGVRIDLVKNQADVVNDNVQKDSNGAPVNDPSSYSWVGVILGNGLFLDNNSNLSVDLIRLFNIQGNFQIEESDLGLFPHHTVYTRKGDIFERKSDNQKLNARVQFSQDQIDFTFEPPLPSGVVYVEDGDVSYARSQAFSSKLTLHTVSERHVDLVGMLAGIAYTLKGENELKLGTKYQLKKKGNTIEIAQNGLLFNADPMIFIRTLTGCYFTNQSGDAFNISRDGDTISVEKNGKLDRTYKITLLPETAADTVTK